MSFTVWGAVFGFEPTLTLVFGGANLMLVLFGMMILEKGKIWK